MFIVHSFTQFQSDLSQQSDRTLQHKLSQFAPPILRSLDKEIGRQKVDDEDAISWNCAELCNREPACNCDHVECLFCVSDTFAVLRYTYIFFSEDQRSVNEASEAGQRVPGVWKEAKE